MPETVPNDTRVTARISALPTSWGKMFVYITFWAQALRPYIWGIILL
ncbi:MAG: hypothetical protein AB4426_29050 [Xenococcaceae cyanobacterium]